MKKNKILSSVTIATLLLSANSFAQTAPNPGEGRPPRGEMREERKELRQEWREGRQEIRQEFRDDVKDARQEWKSDRIIMKNSSTSSSTIPRKEFKENIKEARQDFRENMKDMRENMREMLPKRIPDTALAAIATKLGVSTSTLQAQIASGTPLREIVKDKISPDEMKSILPPKTATFTKRLEEKGFFNGIRASFFGPREEIIKEVRNEFGEVVSTSTEPVAPKGFFRRFFNF